MSDLKFIKITPEMKCAAEQRNVSSAKKYGTKGTRLVEKNKKIRETGFLGEQIVKSAYPHLELSTDDDYDFHYKNITFDVKAVGCNGMPRPDYVGTVFGTRDRVKADYLIFVRVMNDGSGGWVCGFIKVYEFFDKCTTVTAGTVNNNFTYDHDRFTIEYGKLVIP